MNENLTVMCVRKAKKFRMVAGNFGRSTGICIVCVIDTSVERAVLGWVSSWVAVIQRWAFLWCLGV